MGHSSFGEDGFCFVGISLVLEVYLRYIHLIVSGAVAHLARAIEWHSIGGRFDPDQLQIDKSDKKNIWNQKGHRPYDSDYSLFIKQLIKSRQLLSPAVFFLFLQIRNRMRKQHKASLRSLISSSYQHCMNFLNVCRLNTVQCRMYMQNQLLP